MSGKIRMVKLQPRVVQRVFGGVLAIVIAISLMMPAGGASACATSNTATNTVSIVHKAEFSASTSTLASVSKFSPACDCCDKGSQAGDCSTVHCFGCAGAISAPESNYAIDSVDISHAWPEHSAPAAAELAPDFRPPRSAA